MIGTTVGNYRIVEKLGDGGMGAVFRAVDEMLDREVAIKVLRPELARNAALIERFRQEAIALARLNHPRIATLHGLERHEASFLMIMEYVRGETLEAIVQRSGHLAWPRAAELCAATLDALDHAHDKGVVHRDIKPANIMLATNGAVKVMDFGIARLMGKSRQTQIGHAVGTPMYMAPEQLRGEEVDGRTDLYAAGAVLFELVTGRMAFEAESDYALMMKQLNEPPPAASSLVREIPAVIDEIIQRAMAKRREDRFPHASAFREALEGAIGTLAPPSRRTPVPAETRLAAPAPGAVTPGDGVSRAAGGSHPGVGSGPAGTDAAPATDHLVQATAEHALTPPQGAAETRLGPPAEPTGARSPAATRLADTPAAYGTPATRLATTPSASPHLGQASPGAVTSEPERRQLQRGSAHWMRDWRTYAIAGALFLGAGLAIRTLRTGPNGQDEARRDVDPVAVAANVPTTVTPDRAANQQREDAAALLLNTPAGTGRDSANDAANDSARERGAGGGSGAGDAGKSSGTSRRPPRTGTPPVSGGTERPIERRGPAPVSPIVPPGDVRTDPVRTDPVPPPREDGESEATAIANIREAIASAAASLSGRSTGAAESLLGGATQEQWVALMKEGRISITPSGAPSVQLRGTRASADFEASVNVRSPFGANKRRSAQFSAELARGANGWRVTSLRPAGALELK